jgi:hypothetical protein
MRRASPALALSVLLWLGGCAPEGPTAFVTFNVAPDGNCLVSATGGTVLFYPIGKYDVAPGAIRIGQSDTRTNNCNSPYVLNLLVNSYLRPNADVMLGRAEPNILQVHSAEVQLMTLERQRIDFNRGGQNLPNPFRVTTNNSLPPSMGTQPSQGIAAVEVIPTAYAAQLDNFGADGIQILAEIQIFGTTTGDVDIEVRPFVYPIELCYGCMQVCFQDITAVFGSAATMDDIYGNECADNAGADGRVCIDRGC